MKPIKDPPPPPTKPGDQGAEVANLQEGLMLLLDKNAIQIEGALRNAFGQEPQDKDATRKIVALFQSKDSCTHSRWKEMDAKGT